MSEVGLLQGFLQLQKLIAVASGPCVVQACSIANCYTLLTIHKNRVSNSKCFTTRR